MIDSLGSQDNIGVFQKALDALEYLGSESRMASRCRKYLQKLLHGIMSLGEDLLDSIHSLLVLRVTVNRR